MSERFGTWQLETVIAVGGLGEIWRAVRHDEVVALKRLHTHLVRNDEIRAQFMLEQRLTTQLPRHRNLVHAIEAGTVDDRPYLALALAPGQDLRRWLVAPQNTALDARGEASRGATPASTRRVGGIREPSERSGPGGPSGPSGPTAPDRRTRALAIALAAADAIEHLHQNGYVHGDVNPGNLVVSSTDHVTLIDLGVAREIGAGGVVRGTHAYMAPEQVRGERWTCATDVFALGVVLWELVAGARLFHRGPPWLSMAAVVEAEVPPLDDPAIDAIAQAALVKDPARRIASAAELAARLQASGATRSTMM
jgi:serine/threonine protein kinase